MNILSFLRKLTRKENETALPRQRRGFRQVNHDEEMEIHLLYSRGHSMVEIAELLDRSAATIHRTLKKGPPGLKRLVQERRVKAKESGLDTSGDIGHYRAGHWVRKTEESDM